MPSPLQIGESPTGSPRPSIVITVAQVDDIAALQATAAACWWATYRTLFSASFIEQFLARAYSNTRLQIEIANVQCRFLVVKHDDDVIGFGQAGPTFPRRDPAPVAPADLYRLYLLSTWQRQGIGARLLAELEVWLRQQAYLYYGAYVHEHNEPAKHFYYRQGFTHKPECDVENEWYLVKRLDE